jgi:twinkle protein
VRKKQSYGNSEVVAKFKELGIEVRANHKQYKTLCPVCSHTRKKKREPVLSVNLEEGKWFCHNPGCGFIGSVGGSTVDESQDLFSWTDMEIELPQYDPADYPLRKDVIEWFAERGISKETLKQNRIGSGENGSGVYITYPYYLDSEVVKVKFRALDEKRFWQSPGGIKTLYGIDSFFDENNKLRFNSAYIVEGENDKLALNEAGFFNVVSVPDGAPDPEKAKHLAKKFDYLEDDKVILFFELLDEVIFATDADGPGQFLADELARRIGLQKSFRVQFPEDIKDPNEMLAEYGPEGLTSVLSAKRRFPVEGTYEVTDFRQDVRRLYEDGVQPGLSSGYIGWDEITTFEFGRLNIWTGAPNSGKSEFLDALNIQMAKLHDLRIGNFAPEAYPPEKHFRRLAQKLIGKPFGKPGDDFRMSLEELAHAERWIQERVKWIQPRNPTPEAVVEAAQKLVLRDGIQVMMFDPWNNMQHNPGNLPFHQYISQKLDLFREFARQYKLILHLVVHPRKLGKRADGEWEVASSYDLKDASEWFDKADNIFSVWRSILTPAKLPVEVHNQKGKDAEIVRPGTVGLFTFDWTTTKYKWVRNEGDSLLDRGEQRYAEFEGVMSDKDYYRNRLSDDEDDAEF